TGPAAAGARHVAACGDRSPSRADDEELPRTQHLATASPAVLALGSGGVVHGDDDSGSGHSNPSRAGIPAGDNGRGRCDTPRSEAVMAGRAWESVSVPAWAWEREEARSLLQARDVPGLLRFAQRFGGASQTRLASATG